IQIALILAVVLSVQVTWLGWTFGNHCILYDGSTNTINVICGSARLSDISEQLVNSTIIDRESKTVWVLNANLVVGNSAALDINSTDTTWLKINSTSTKTPHYVEVLGDMSVDSVKIT